MGENNTPEGIRSSEDAVTLEALNYRVEHLQFVLNSYPDHKDFDKLTEQVNDALVTVRELADRVEDVEADIKVYADAKGEALGFWKRVAEQVLMLIVGGLLTALIGHFFI